MSSEEKILILTMLEEGKISSDEAAKLLEAIDEHDGSSKKKESSGKHHRSGNNFENLGDELGDKISEFADKMGELGENIASKIEEKVRNVEHKKNSNNSQKGSLLDRILSSIDFPGFTNDFYTTKENYDIDVENPSNYYLHVEGINGKIQIDTHPGNNILIEALVKTRDELDQKAINVEADGSRLIVKPAIFHNVSISYIILIPNKTFKEVFAKTSNSKIVVNGVQFEIAELFTSNSKIEVIDSNIKNLEAKTSNSKISLCNSHFESLSAKTSNSKIEYVKSYGKDISLITSNSTIEVNNIVINGVVKADLVTSNSKIIFSADNYNGGFDITADTSMGNIVLNIPNLMYKESNQNKLSSKHLRTTSSNFEQVNDKIYLTAKTSNGSIYIG